MKGLLLTLLVLAISVTSAMASEISVANVLQLMNEERAREGLQPLRGDLRLGAAASDRMRHMEEQQFWAHDAPDGTRPFVWIAPRGYHYRAAGENLARGFDTAELLVQSWMESPGHRANILGADYSDAGISIIDGYTTGPGTGRSIVVLFAVERAE